MNHENEILELNQSVSPYEAAQHQRNLGLILWVVAFISTSLAAVNLAFGDIRSGAIIFSLAPVCILALFFNRRGYYYSVGITLCTLMLSVIIYDIYDVGGLTADLAPVAFPVIIIVSALILGKKGIYIVSVLSILSVTILGELEVYEILPYGGSTDQYDIATVVILIIGTALLLWVIIQNAEENFNRIKKDDDMLRVSYELTLEGLTKAIEFRDRETEHHSQRVVAMTVLLGRQMGLKPEALLILRRGALLHDIGKMAVPDNILLKEGPLTDEEWQIMRQHPVKAMEILSTIPFLKASQDIPYSHHENWDGSGYPLGLKGEEIPLFARIFSIIDQWEALTSDRSYRKAWTYEKVIGYIHDNRGKIYDPRVVDAFFTLLKQDPAAFYNHDKEKIPVFDIKNEDLVMNDLLPVG